MTDTIVIYGNRTYIYKDGDLLQEASIVNWGAAAIRQAAVREVVAAIVTRAKELNALSAEAPSGEEEVGLRGGANALFSTARKIRSRLSAPAEPPAAENLFTWTELIDRLLPDNGDPVRQHLMWAMGSVIAVFAGKGYTNRQIMAACALHLAVAYENEGWGECDQYAIYRALGLDGDIDGPIARRNPTPPAEPTTLRPAAEVCEHDFSVPELGGYCGRCRKRGIPIERAYRKPADAGEDSPNA